MANFHIKKPEDGESIPVVDDTAKYTLVVAGLGPPAKKANLAFKLTYTNAAGVAVPIAGNTTVAPPSWVIVFPLGVGQVDTAPAASYKVDVTLRGKTQSSTFTFYKL